MASSALPFAARRAAMVLLLTLAACSATKNRAPVEERIATRPTPVAAPVELPTTDAAGKPLSGIENLGKPGYYAVRPGDTLIRVGLENGQNWRDLVRWNNLENPNVIEVGQVLRVVPPGVDAGIAATRPVASTRTDSRPLDPKAASAAASVPALNGAAVPTAATPTSTTAATTATAMAATMPAASAPATNGLAPADPPPARGSDDDITFAWPAAGPVSAPFEEGKVKGLTINGKAGDPVLAAADGRVVYSGSGLRGYGNLVILKHNATYLTAYAHNQALLVKEDQNVRRGQKIAEMGATDAERVQLHFEIRKQGKPIDPARLLPAR